LDNLRDNDITESESLTYSCLYIEIDRDREVNMDIGRQINRETDKRKK
jgi:hypothetical protein